SVDESAARRRPAATQTALERRLAVPHPGAEVGGTHARASCAIGTATAPVEAALRRGEDGPPAAPEAVRTVGHARPRSGARRRTARIDTPGVIRVAAAPGRSERREA